MADKSIGDLNFAPGTVDDSNTLFVVQQSGAAYKLSGHEFIIAMESVLDGHGGINNITYTPPVAPSLTGTMVITLADQSTTSVSIQNGKGISTITDYWKASSSSSSVPTSWSTTRESMTSTNRYLWHYQHIVYNDNTYLDTTKTVVGVYGDTGDAWYVWIRYSGSQPTQDSDMGTIPDNWMGIYSGTSSTAPVHYTSYQWFEIKGEKGDTGNSITSVTKTSTVGLVDTYTVYVGNPAVSVGTFEVTNGKDGEGVASDTPPLMDGTASAGISTDFARGDHIHPTDTSRASQRDMTTAQNNITALQNKKTTISLSATWTTAGTDIYSQAITISGTTNNTKVDLQPNAAVILQLANDGVTGMYVENNSGLTVYAVGAKPSTALSIQATYYDVV